MSGSKVSKTKNGYYVGNYHNTIVATLSAAGQGTDQATIDKALFICLTEGELEYSTICGNSCVNEPFGSQKHDHC
jgi:hypothetical protein